MASPLLSETKDSVRNFALLYGLESFKKAIDDLLYSVETGEGSFKHANWIYMSTCNKIKKMHKYLMVQ